MNIGIDIDDTLADSFEYFQPAISDFYGMDLAEVLAKNISYNTMPEEWLDRLLDFSAKHFDGPVVDTPIKEGAVEVVARLKAAGHRIVIITARDTRFYKDPDGITTQQLAKQGIVYDRLMCTIDKAAACQEESIDLFIDDSIRNCDSVASNTGAEILLFTSKANIEEEAPYQRVSSWVEIEEYIGKMSQRY